MWICLNFSTTWKYFFNVNLSQRLKQKHFLMWICLKFSPTEILFLMWICQKNIKQKHFLMWICLKFSPPVETKKGIKILRIFFSPSYTISNPGFAGILTSNSSKHSNPIFTNSPYNPFSIYIAVLYIYTLTFSNKSLYRSLPWASPLFTLHDFHREKIYVQVQWNFYTSIQLLPIASEGQMWGNDGLPKHL